jgi:hypothetical protein
MLNSLNAKFFLIIHNASGVPAVAGHHRIALAVPGLKLGPPETALADRQGRLAAISPGSPAKLSV